MGPISWLLAGLLVGISAERLLPGYVPGMGKETADAMERALA